MRKLTIGIATHDDYDGLYFSIQAIRMYHREVLNDIEFVIVDNSPNSKHGECVKKLVSWIKEPVQYLPFTNYQSSMLKGKVFELSDTPYTLCMDSHVLLEPGSLKKLIDFYDSGKDYGNLLHGPLVYDDHTSISTFFDLTHWGSFMWGRWANDERGKDINDPPFEIPAQGMGLFSCRTDSWLGFNKNFKGFGGEEGYIHEKYRKNGKKILCLPFLRWMHKFERPNGATYPNNLHERFRNFYIGFTELGLDKTELLKEFKSVITPAYIERLDEELKSIGLK
jgi:hypothetical protein